VKARLLDVPDGGLDLLVVTHVDADHIAGVLPLLSDIDVRHLFHEVWFNGYVHLEQASDLLGPIDGERLTRAIVDGGLAWNAPFHVPDRDDVGGPVVVLPTGDLPRIPLPGGAEVILLSPTPKKLVSLRKTWRQVVEGAHLVPGQGADYTVPALPAPGEPFDDPDDVRPLPDPLDLDVLAKAPTAKDTAAANGSSIAFVLSHGTGAARRRVLFGADAHPQVLTPALRRLAAEEGTERVQVDLCKLPHHGSQKNITIDLLAALDTTQFLFSTNGDHFDHPDVAGVARAATATDEPTLWFNFRSAETLPWYDLDGEGITVRLPKKGTAGMVVRA
jgi:hypothetical protein